MNAWKASNESKRHDGFTEYANSIGLRMVLPSDSRICNKCHIYARNLTLVNFVSYCETGGYYTTYVTLIFVSVCFVPNRMITNTLLISPILITMGVHHLLM